MGSFIHLHTHSHYSLLNALPTIKDLVNAAKEDGMESLALTDNGNMYGTIAFYEACRKNDIKPIIGVDFYVAVRTRHDKEHRIDNVWSRLVLLAETYEGYLNLLQLVTTSYLEGFYYKPRIDHLLLEQHSKGLIAIIPSFSGETSKALKGAHADRAEEVLTWYTKTFGTKNVFLEITHHPEIDGHQKLMSDIIKLSNTTSVSLVAAHDVYYIKPEDRQARETLTKIQTGNFGTDTGFGDEDDFSFISTETAKKYFDDHPEALANSVKIAERCNVEIPMEWTFPNYIIESGRTPDDELRHITYEGLPWRGVELTDEVKERIDYELSVIAEKDYSTYFLVMADLVRYALKNDILTTTRGSAAGSMVSYLTGITNVNPIEYMLPFERFLNRDRPSAPDVDLDIADDRRDEMIQYARDKYGENHVAQIGTFGTLLARAVVRDVARAMGHPYNVGDTIAKAIPMGSQGFPMTIDRALKESPDFEKLYKKDSTVKEVVDLAKKLEGRVRHISVHAAGVVISPKPLVEYVPLQFDPKETGKLITQYDMHAVGEDGRGLLKFDFLGIKNLAILAAVVKRVKGIHKVDIDIENIPLDDKKTFDMLARGETMGVFQLSGQAMTQFLKELRPTTIHDINAMVALYRPGPMKNIPHYIARKQGREPIRYLHPKMKNFLERSYGILVYQDDIMSAALELAGYTWKTVDKLRKAIGKKIPAEMAQQHDIFVDGCIKESGMTKEQAEAMWDLFEPFQGYGFNKAHAACYGKVAYQTAYMKANYPTVYMASVLTADSGNVDKIAEATTECARMGIEVLPPDVNESYGFFTVAQDNVIRFGLHSIKNFGEGIADVIIRERKDNGPYTSIANFLQRVQNRNLNKKTLEALIKSGALDSLEDRVILLNNIETLLTYAKEFASVSEYQDSLFGSTDSAPLTLFQGGAEVTKYEKLSWEKELLGLYVSGHPLDRFKDKLENHDMTVRRAREEIREGIPVILYGLIEEAKPITTKKGEMMSFIKVADYTGSIEAVIFPKIYEEYRETLLPEQCVGIKGRVSGRNGETSIVVEAVKKLQ